MLSPHYEPYESGGVYSWWHPRTAANIPDACKLPTDLFDRLPHCAASHRHARYYLTREDAASALEAARRAAEGLK